MAISCSVLYTLRIVRAAGVIIIRCPCLLVYKYEVRRNKEAKGEMYLS